LAVQYRLDEKRLLWRAEQYFQKYLDALLCNSFVDHNESKSEIASVFRFH
jgi:hypothetical protein